VKSDNKQAFAQGVKDGIPIALGYFAVAFSLGIAAKIVGLNPFQGFLSSFLNHASAGEYAEFTVIGSQAPYWEMVLIIMVANARYLLMSTALSQRFDPKTKIGHRLIVGFGITDEIFGAAINRPGCINPWYVYGLMFLPLPLWASGTAIGIVAGNILPASVTSALSVALYGMFIAIIIPPARKSRVIALIVAVSFILSFVADRFLSVISEGMRTIILTVVISALAALIFPHEEVEE